MASQEQNIKVLKDINAFRQDWHRKALSLNRPGVSIPAAWFLGPKGENGQVLRDLITQAIDHHIESRTDFSTQFEPKYGTPDPGVTSILDFEGSLLKTGLPEFKYRFEQVLGYLRGSIPMASYRNQSHMYWDVTIPSIVGYIATCLYNQNNCTPEASPVTTVLEMEVGDDLCRMLGYHVPDPWDENTDQTRPWGHITCDGSVANIESMWAARNVKYVPVAMAAALREDADLAAARDVTVKTLTGVRARLVDLDSWGLLNLPMDEAIGLATRIARTAGIEADVLKDAMARHSVQDLGLLEFHRRYLPDTPSPAVTAPSTAHYSWPKAASIVGLGRVAIRPIKVDLDARMDPVELRRALEECLRERRPVVQVVSVMGTTEESAVDPFAEIVAIREEFRERGMEFSLHVDAAWGGYFASMMREPRSLQVRDRLEEEVRKELDPTLREQKENELARYTVQLWGVDDPDRDPKTIPNLNSDLLRDTFRWKHTAFAPAIKMNAYVTRQYSALKHADSITVDPHKGGFILYPAGALCYRNGAMRHQVAFASPVVDHGDVAASVGFYGIEGSKPGASATAVYLSHSLIPTDWDGYGQLLGQCIYASKRFYAALVTMAGPKDVFTVTPFQRLPAERVGATASEIRDQLDTIRNRFVPHFSDRDLVAALSTSPTLLELFREMGSDQCIVAYSFNFKTADGLNTSIDLLNEMNEFMFQKMSVQTLDDKLPSVEMIVTASTFDPENYGQAFVDHYAKRCGLVPEPGKGIKFLISTNQNPWITATDDGNFVPRLMTSLAEIARGAADKVISRHGLTAMPTGKP